MMYTEFVSYIYLESKIRVCKDGILKGFWNVTMLYFGLGSGIWMSGLLLSLNCRYTFSKLFYMHIIFHSCKTHKSNHQKNRNIQTSEGNNLCG